MYNIIRGNNKVTIVREYKSGKISEVCQIINTEKGKLLMIDKSKINSYIVKSDNKLAELELVGSAYIGSFASKINIYIRPHYQEFHNVIMTESRTRYNLARTDNMQHKKIYSHKYKLNDKAILNNMLECIASI